MKALIVLVFLTAATSVVLPAVQSESERDVKREGRWQIVAEQRTGGGANALVP